MQTTFPRFGEKEEETVANIAISKRYEIGAPYEHLPSKFFLAIVTSPPPNLEADIYDIS